MRIVKQVLNRSLPVGGKEHLGWLPSGASLPQPMPIQVAIVDLKIVEDAPGSVLLICESHNTNNNWDNWFESVEDAQAAAKEWRGIDESEWK